MYMYFTNGFFDNGCHDNGCYSNTLTERGSRIWGP